MTAIQSVATPTAPAETPATPKVKTTADVLRAAAWIIEERGWCQTRMESRDGRDCLIGSIIKAVGYGDLGMAAHRSVMGYLGSAINFNDAPGRTAAEVTAALRAAADASERAS